MIHSRTALFGFILSLCVLTATSDPATAGQWSTNFESATAQAKAESKPILLYFSGSDWCAPCIRFKKQVLETEAFQAFSKEELVSVLADFPRMKANRLSKEQQAHNDELAERFNPKGSFPATLLLKYDGTVLKRWDGYSSKTTEEFMAEIRPMLSQAAVPESAETGMQVYRRELLLMGSRFGFSVVAADDKEGNRLIDLAIAEVQRIEKMISSWNPGSQTSAINRAAGIGAIHVDEELIQLIQRAKRISELTQGAFDITFGSIDDQIWHFDGSLTQLPDSATAKKAVRRIDYSKVEVWPDSRTVRLADKGMKLGFGGIGKGYAAEQAKKVLLAEGVTGGIINAGGDLTVWGNQPDGSDWSVGIAHPDAKTLPFSWMKMTNTSVATSGNYEKYVVIDGIKYTHIIDPRTGYPVHGIKSVTVICDNAELADALATSVFILGKEVGLDLIRQLKGVEALIIDDQNEVFASNNLQIK